MDSTDRCWDKQGKVCLMLLSQSKDRVSIQQKKYLSLLL